MGWRGLPPSQLWLPWQRAAAAAAIGSEGGGGGWGLGGRDGRMKGPPSGARGGGRGARSTSCNPSTSPGVPRPRDAGREADLGEAG